MNRWMPVVFAMLLFPGEIVFSAASREQSNAKTVTVLLKNPIYPESDAQHFDVLQVIDEEGFPSAYRMTLVTDICREGVCEILHIVLEWDELGRFRKLVPVSGRPLTKADHEEFSADDYHVLESILTNRNSELRWYAMRYAAEDGVDGISGATEVTLRGKVVSGAAYTSWALWHWVHGPVVGQLQDYTIRLMTNEHLLYFLSSDDVERVCFALQALSGADREWPAEIDEAVFEALGKAEKKSAGLALRFLNENTDSEDHLDHRLVDMLGSTSDAAEWEILDFLGRRKALSAQVAAELTGRLSQLTFIGKRKALWCLDQR